MLVDILRLLNPSLVISCAFEDVKSLDSVLQTCKLSGLFSLDEDFDDEVTHLVHMSDYHSVLFPFGDLLTSVCFPLSQDVLGPDWSPCSVAGPSKAAAAVSSCSLRASSVSHRDQEKTCHQPTGEKLAELCNGAVSGSAMHSGAAQTVAQGLRQICSSSNTACTAEDDFDDWDVDLADLDECDYQTRQLSTPAAPEPPSSVKTLRPSTYVTIQTPSTRSMQDTSSYCNSIAAPQSLSSAHLHFSRIPAVSPAPSSFSRIPAVSPAPSSFSRTPSHPRQLQKPWMTPQAASQARTLFNTVSPGPPTSVNSSALSPHPLHTPVLTNRLVQLVSASSKLPKKRQRSEAHQPQTRRFPGPAGLLPQQPQGQNLDEIVVSVPNTPSHGAACSSSQSEEEEFSGRAWAAMKAEMGLDERNPSCFLHTYSVVMVLRKAALKQLPRNKVPNMAVLLKSIIHTNADAKAVFKDPTGEIQGTVHRRLLEERCEELKAGAVLLLKQVRLVRKRFICGCFLSIPPQPLPERDAQQPAADLLSCWGQPVHSAPPVCLGEYDDLDELLGEIQEDAYSF
uniref:Homologous recombination factor with OB-fold n=1 Tax=Poecilia reticulata TaxID=8081 RepID=A0A3P9NX71_POERE